MSTEQESRLLGLADRLDSLTRNDKKNTKSVLKEILTLLDLDLAQLATILSVEETTARRWLRGDFMPGLDKILKIKRLLIRKAGSGDIESFAKGRLRRVRIGVTPFWDTALLAAFEPVLTAFGVEPEFCLTPGWSRDVHDQFRANRIDVAIHNQFLVDYDHLLCDPDSIGIAMARPLYVFTGHYVFVSRRRIDTVIHLPGVNADVLEKFKRGLLRLYPGSHPNEIKALIDGAAIAAERGTDMEAAVHIGAGLVKAQLHSERLNAEPNEAERETRTSDRLYSDFVAADSHVDIYCGGLPQNYKLITEIEMSGQDARWRVLLHPSDIRSASLNGIVTRRENASAWYVDRIAAAWFNLAMWLDRWATDQQQPDHFWTCGLATSQGRNILEIINCYVDPEQAIILPENRQKANETVRRWTQFLTAHDLFFDSVQEINDYMIQPDAQKFSRTLWELQRKRVEHIFGCISKQARGPAALRDEPPA